MKASWAVHFDVRIKPLFIVHGTRPSDASFDEHFAFLNLRLHAATAKPETHQVHEALR